jgi:hypothetical protein
MHRLIITAAAALLGLLLATGSALGQATTPTVTVTGTPATATGTPAAATATVTGTPPAATTTMTAQPTVTGTVTPGATGTATTTPVAPPLTRDERYFAQTGYRVDDNVVWDYFNRRGAVSTFGYPVSRPFRFRGFMVQFFQRRVVEIGENGQARQINLLDPGLLPLTRFNGATVPGPDTAYMTAAPPPTDSNATLAFVAARAPDQFDGRMVTFLTTFNNTVTMQIAYPQGGGSPALLPGINLEMWGVPTSGPAYDPNNRNFIYQRFQRGIMHYDVGCNCTQGILLADYLKAVLTGQNLPADVDEQARSTQFYKQYDASFPGWVRNPGVLPNTDMTNAFTPG